MGNNRNRIIKAFYQNEFPEGHMLGCFPVDYAGSRLKSVLMFLGA